VVLVAVLGLVVGRVSGGDDPTEAREGREYSSPAEVADALAKEGFECTAFEGFEFEYASVGTTDAGECQHGDNDVLIVMYPGGEPPADILEDVSERIVAGPNWLIGTSELTDTYAEIISAIGGQLVWDNGPVASGEDQDGAEADLLDSEVTSAKAAILEADGLGVVKFGTTSAVVASLLGPAFEAQGSPDYAPGACDGDVAYTSGEGDGLLVFYDSSAELVGFRYSGASEPTYATGEEIGPGSTVKDLRDAYRERLRSTRIGSLYEFRLDDDSPSALRFTADGSDDDSQIIEVAAGDDCTPDP
jgi:hypothetical protein